MNIHIAQNIGFCDGVQKAFNVIKDRFGKTKNQAKDRQPRAYILGSLVHNDSVSKMVEGWGIRKIKNLRPVKKGDTLIITAHGTSKDVYDRALSHGAKILDATCSRVSAVQRAARHNHLKGSQVIILGDRDHKEVRGINGWCDKKAIIISTLSDARRLASRMRRGKIRKRAFVLVSQTTQNIDLFEKVSALLSETAKEKGLSFQTYDTICRATSGRQKEIRRLADKFSAVIVIGGRDSANTKRLWQIAKSINPRSFWISGVSPNELKRIKRGMGKAQNAAVISGASTPSWEIEELVRSLKSL